MRSGAVGKDSGDLSSFEVVGWLMLMAYTLSCVRNDSAKKSTNFN